MIEDHDNKVQIPGMIDGMTGSEGSSLATHLYYESVGWQCWLGWGRSLLPSAELRWVWPGESTTTTSPPPSYWA